MPTLLAANTFNTTVLTDPAGATGIAAGHKFANNGRQILRIANAATNANAVISLVPGGTVTSGNIILRFLLQIGAVTPVLYTTAGIPVGSAGSVVATAVLAATQPNGNAMSADFPSGTVTGGGSALTGGTTTLTFAGTFAHFAIPAPSIDASGIVGGGTADAQVTTPGTGSGVVYLLGSPQTAGAPAFQYYLLPANATAWIGGFNPNLVNQNGADSQNAFLFYDVPANYTTTVFQLP